MVQIWRDLLFAHWPFSAIELRRVVPSALELDLFQEQGWIGVVPFRMTGIRLRGLPPIPPASASLELNVRTYVTVDGRPGVYFFSLDAEKLLLVMAARYWYRLPYFHARMGFRERDGLVSYESCRMNRKAPPAEFRAQYRPTGEAFHTTPGTLEHWLTARYCLYSIDPRGRVLRAEIKHAPWPLQPAVAEISANTMTAPIGLSLSGPPLLHFARELEVVAWTPETVCHNTTR
jgi:uncharacterized protein YqjF (DUF2071 family)